MFKPKYIITEKLLANVKKINTLVGESNRRIFPHVILVELERTARAISTFASTSIEGNPLPLTEVKKILKSKPSQVRQSEQEVLNYNQALQNLDSLSKKGLITISLDLILLIHKQITNKLLPAYQIGTLRNEAVQVSNPRTRKVVYLPPDAKDAKLLVEELIQFTTINQEKIDPLILSGIFHKQMVLIHPFMDGNGRTTRLATKVLLAHMGLNTFNLFSFENYYNKNITRYFDEVGEQGNYYELVEDINFTTWLEYFTEGIIDELLRVQKIVPEISISPETGLSEHHLKILNFLKQKGFVTDRDYAKLTNRAKATRNLDFNKLIDLKLIVRLGKGKATYYKISI